MEDFFVAERLSKKFDSLTVDVSFSCGKGEMVALLGTSGSGKSTVLRLISGLEKNDCAAKILLDGEEIQNLPPAKRGIGMVFQSGALFNHLRVEDNVSYGLVSRGEKKKTARAISSKMLSRFGLSGFEKRFPDTLSGGEAQRVSLSRTLVLNPKLVLFDEPLSALDAPLRKKLAEEIALIQKEIGFSGILVTHDIFEAQFLCSRIIMMKKGKIIWQGKSQDFEIEHYEM